MTRFGILSFFAVLLLFAAEGCSDSGDSFRGFPCRLKGGEKWSLISMKGEVIAAECSVHRPTPLSCGRFWAQNDNGYWQLYSVESPEKPLIEKEYRYVSNFYDNRALVAERDKPVSVIDREGEVTLELDQIEGKIPGKFINIADGMAVYTVDSLQGVVSFDGRQVLPAEYHAVNMPSCGRIIVSDRNHAAFYASAPSGAPESVAIVFDYSGRECFRISSRVYGRMAESFTAGFLPVAIVAGEKESWGLLDERGRQAVAPDSINRAITDIAGNNYVFMNDGGLFGVRSLIDGSVVLEPRFASARFLDDDHIAVSEGDSTAGGNERYSIIDLKGERTVKRTFLALSPLFSGHLFACIEEGRWVIMDPEGEMRSDLPEIEEAFYSTEEPSSFLTSDYIDIGRLVRGTGMSPVGTFGMTFGSSAKELLGRQAEELDFIAPPMAANYGNTDEINFFPTVEGEMVAVTVTFPAALSHPVFTPGRIIDYLWGAFPKANGSGTLTEYEFTDETPSRFTVIFNNYGKLRGKLRRLYGALTEHFSAFGKVAASNSGATLIDLGSGRYALVAIEDNSVKAVWGLLPEADRSLHPYEGNQEKLKVIFAEQTFGYGGEVK